MKAEDTVVKADELCRLVCSEYVTRFFERKDCAGLDCEDCSLEAQAKITFKAATEAERKELGQWLEEHWEESPDFNNIIKRLRQGKSPGGVDEG